MALYRLEFLTSNDVDITSGKTVTLNDGVDVSSVVPGTAVFINNQVVEAVSGQNVSLTQSTITLRYDWPFAAVTSGRLVAFNTFEGLNTAITRLNDVINSVPDFTGATGQGLLYNNGSNTYSIKPSTLFGESLLNSADAAAAKAILQITDPSTFGANLIAQTDAASARGVLNITDPSTFGTSLITQLDAPSARSTLEITDPSAFGQTLITQSDAASARAALEILPASTADAQDGTNDSKYMTSAKVVEGAPSPRDVWRSFPTGISMDTLTLPGFSRAFNCVAPVPAGYAESDNDFIVMSLSIPDQNYVKQMVHDVRTENAFFRSRINGTYGRFDRITTSSNLSNAQNLSGATVPPNGAIAGSSLNPSQGGTWRNVSGNDILDNTYGLFMKD